MALVKDYLEKTIQYQQQYGEKTLLLMQVGAFFEVYGLENKLTGEITGSQIVDFSRICDMNIADKKICVGKEGVLMAGFGHYMIDKYLKKLQEAGYTTVVYTQDEQNKNTTRSLSGIYSPGTYFSSDTTDIISNNTCCIWIHVSNALKTGGLGKRMVHIGAANINIYTGKSAMFEFYETYLLNPTTFDELERFISIYQPSESIVIGNLPITDLNEIISYANISCKTIHKISLLDDETDVVKRALNSEKQTYQKELLKRFFKDISDIDFFYQSFYQNAIATQAYCFLLDFIYQHNPSLTTKISEPTFENCNDRLILANHSLKQLNIIDDLQGAGNKFSSVEKILNICITSMGKRHFSYHFLNPTTDPTFLEKEYNITEHILEKYAEYDFLKPKLQTIKDISRLNRNIIMKKISPKSLLQLYKNLFVVQELAQIIKKDTVFSDYLQSTVLQFGTSSAKASEVLSLQNVTNYSVELVQFFEKNFCMDLCEDIEITQQFETIFIQRGINTKLDENTQLYLESMDKLEAIRIYLNSCIAKYEKNAKTSDYIKLHETEKNNFKLVATKRRCVILKQSVPKMGQNIFLNYKSSYDQQEKHFDFLMDTDTPMYFHAQTASNDSIGNKQIDELCKNISSVKIQLKDLLTDIYRDLLKQLSEFQQHIETIIQFLTMVDVVLVKATIAKKYNYCKPTIQKQASDKSFVDAKGLRHCLIEHIQQNELYITNDIILGKTGDNSNISNISNINGILLYGTNAVGKTSLIRALGIAVIMAQSGLYVPCSSFIFSPYKYIFTRIIGNDNIFKGLSTFAVEMSELRTILRLSDKNSLVLGDELCSGTESISAQSIFVAGIQQLFHKESSFIFATHMHEIIHYDELDAMPTVHLKHMSVMYDKERDVLVYDRKLKDGPGGNMYGLEVCRSLNLPEDFLELANSIRMKYYPETASILSLKTSHYNSQKIVGKCEVCNKEMGTEVHHLQHQQIANSDGFIHNEQNSFHKNHPGNLLTVCEKCHHAFHEKGEKSKKKIKTTKGVQLCA